MVGNVLYVGEDERGKLNIFAILVQDTSKMGSIQMNTGTTTNDGLIVGGTVGSVVFLASAAYLVGNFFFFYRKNKLEG